MGAFFISLADSRAAQLDQVETLYRAQGFSAIQRLTTRHFGLLYCRKQNLDSDSLYRLDGDNFCLSTGTLLYRSAKGAEACERLWHDWQAGRIAHDQLFGNFALLLYRGGELHLYGDPQGVYPIWQAQDQRIFASGPLPVLLCAPRLTLLAQSVYEYVLQEAVFGGDTLFAELSRLTPGEAIRFTGTAMQRIPSLITGQADHRLSDEQRLDAIHARLRDQFRAIASCFGNEIDSALSGGYDSRLLLALMREQGLSPHLHVYGQATSPDVTVAKAIATGEALDLQVINKAEQPRLSETQLVDVVQRNLLHFNGGGADGLIDNGQDLATRQARTRDGRLQLNGGGGEVLRNFNYLPDRSYSVREYLYSFYARFDPATCGAAFDQTRYLNTLGDKIRAHLGITGDRLERRQIEQLYGGFRCTYWMGQNNAINNQFGCFLTPFVDQTVTHLAYDLSIAAKNHGRAEAALIRKIDPRLARYPSDYGHNFVAPPPWRRIAKDYATLLRPPWLRRYLYRWHRHDRRRWPYYLQPAYVEAILPGGPAYLAPYFQLAQIRDESQYRRILSVELLMRWLADHASARLEVTATAGTLPHHTEIDDQSGAFTLPGRHAD